VPGRRVKSAAEVFDRAALVILMLAKRTGSA
jgi:hypothetical protein